jgi:hypothetical protein
MIPSSTKYYPIKTGVLDLEGHDNNLSNDDLHMSIRHALTWETHGKQR